MRGNGVWRGIANVWKTWCPDCKKGIVSFARGNAEDWFFKHMQAEHPDKVVITP